MSGLLIDNVLQVEDDQEKDMDEEFEAAFATANTLETAINLYSISASNNESQRIFDKALQLATKTSEVFSLCHYVDTGSKDERLMFDKALELTQTEEDLDCIFGFLHENPSCFEYRNVLRKVFDKADGLGMPTYY